jgi:hypothetical protein
MNSYMNDLEHMVTRNKCLTNIDTITYSDLQLHTKYLIFIIKSNNEILFIFVDCISRLIIRFSYFVNDEILLIKYISNHSEILLLKNNLFSFSPSGIIEKSAPQGLITYIPDNTHTGKSWK